jgi:hypothetical protein
MKSLGSSLVVLAFSACGQLPLVEVNGLTAIQYHNNPGTISGARVTLVTSEPAAEAIESSRGDSIHTE